MHLNIVPLKVVFPYSIILKTWELAKWGPSGPDRTTKIFRTGPNGPGPDLSEKDCDKMVQKRARIWLCSMQHVWFVFESLLLSYKCELYYKVNPLGEEKKSNNGKQF